LPYSLLALKYLTLGHKISNEQQAAGAGSPASAGAAAGSPASAGGCAARPLACRMSRDIVKGQVEEVVTSTKVLALQVQTYLFY
jgi:hypothetical protein